MKRSEFNAKLTELFGDDDVEIYLDCCDGEGNGVFTICFDIIVDNDRDARIVT